MAVLVSSCCVKVAVATAIAMTATVVNPSGQMLVHQTDKAGYTAFNSPVLTLASLESSLAAVDSAPAQLAVTSPREATQAVAVAAAEATLGGLVYDVVRGAAIAAAIAVLPLWWIGFPITFPIGWAVTQQLIFPANFQPLNFYGDPLGIFNLLFIASAVALPLALVGKFLPPRDSSSATPTAAVPSAASTASLTDTTAAPTDEPAIEIDMGIRESAKPAAPRSKRPAKSAAAVVSTEALDKRNDAPSVSKANAVSSRHAAGRSGVNDEARQRS